MIKKAYADTSGGQCHYRYQSGASDPIVFLHQTPSSSQMFEAIMRRLQDYSTYAIDTPGFGQSFHPDHVPTMAEYSAWLVEAIQSIAIDRVHLFGHHTGSSMAIQIAQDHPDLITSLTMIGPFIATADEKEEMRKTISSDWGPVEDGSHLMKAWNLVGNSLGAKGNIELHHREVVDALRAHESAHQTHEAVWDHDFIKLFKSVECPMLVMCAPDDVLYPFFHRANELRPDSVSIEIKGKNLEPDLDPDAITEHFKSFIENL